MCPMNSEFLLFLVTLIPLIGNDPTKSILITSAFSKENTFFLLYSEFLCSITQGEKFLNRSKGTPEKVFGSRSILKNHGKVRKFCCTIKKFSFRPKYRIFFLNFKIVRA